MNDSRNMTSLIGRLGIGVIALSACRGSEGAIPVTIAASAAMPELVRVPIRNRVDTLMWKLGYQIAVSASGKVIVVGEFYARPGEALRNWPAQIIDPDADTIIQLGPRGEGPGEIMSAASPLARGDTFDLRDNSRMSMLRFSDKGTFLGEHRISESNVLFIGAVGDSIDQITLGPSKDTLPRLWRYTRDESFKRPLIVSPDTFEARLLGVGAPRPRITPAPFASMPGKFALADAMNYRIRVFNDAGAALYDIHRALPPRLRAPRELEEFVKSQEAGLREFAKDGDDPPDMKKVRTDAATQSIDHFTWRGMHFDGHGRLWVIGAADDDSTFADVFADSVFLGRKMFACPRVTRRMAVNGDWLALVCANDKSESSPFELQLYRMVAGK